MNIDIADLLLDLDGLEEEDPPARFLPERLEILCRATGLEKHEMRSLYRAFKEECPNGAITEIKFRHIYCQFFPHGGTVYVFNLFIRCWVNILIIIDHVCCLFIKNRIKSVQYFLL